MRGVYFEPGFVSGKMQKAFKQLQLTVVNVEMDRRGVMYANRYRRSGLQQ